MAATSSSPNQPRLLKRALNNNETSAGANGGGDARMRWLSRFEGLLAVFSFCQCHPESLMGCQALKDLDQQQQDNGSAQAPLCLCFYNPQNEQVWPCFKPDEWLESSCRACTSLGNCAFEHSDAIQQEQLRNDTGNVADVPSWPCLCAPAIRCPQECHFFQYPTTQ